MSVAVNGVEVEVAPGASPELAAARELLRQRAVAAGMIAADCGDAAEIERGIEDLLAREVATPAPAEAECRRYYDAHPAAFRSGELIEARHILFQVTRSTPVAAVRAKAEETLAQLLREPERFAALAAELSNCPSGGQGGSLGQIARGDMLPEFEAAVFREGAAGVLRELVKTRHGFHVVMVERRIPGRTVPFELAQQRIAEHLRASVEERALRQYLQVLAGRARIEGVELDAAPTPLVQ